MPQHYPHGGFFAGSRKLRQCHTLLPMVLGNLPTSACYARMNQPKKDDSAMTISIKDPDTDNKIRDLVALTGESITQAVRIAIEQRLRRESSRRRAGVANRLLNLSLAKNGRKLFEGNANDTIGYDEFGLPT